MLLNIFNVLLIILGFGLVIVVHELGHFLAAKWAGVRVHAFAVGFGSAIVSFRKGLGLRFGSSEPEYQRLIAAQRDDATNPTAISPTEYRLNWFPFGGYVKMLGQEDLSPITASTASDSFAAKPVWKRMVIISGGVFMNVVLAGVLFMASYLVGISEISPIVGDVVPGSPADKAGLRAGDRVIRAGGAHVDSFNDLVLATAMAQRETPLPLEVMRDGSPTPVALAPVPEKGAMGLLQIGAAPSPSTHLLNENMLRRPDDRAAYIRNLASAGLGAAQPGMTLVAIAGAPLEPHETTALPLGRALEAAQGAPVAATFRDAGGKEETIELRATPVFQSLTIKRGEERFASRHVLGLVPVMRVLDVEPRAREQGLLPGDVFERLGSASWPSVAAGIAEVRASKGETIDLVIIRDGERRELRARVDDEGRIGFSATDTANDSALLASTPTNLAPSTDDPDAAAPSFPASRLVPSMPGGSRIERVGDAAVATLRDVREALKAQTQEAHAAGLAADTQLTIVLPAAEASPENEPRRETITLALSPDDVRTLHGLGWNASGILAMFDLAQYTDRASDPLHAVAKGVEKTHEIMMMTYVTFLRLFQGSVPVDQLHGSVGITHVGSQVAERGFIYLVFFLGLISVNLAVVNFLPLPIVDGGHMVFLAIEGLTKKPVSIAVQNAATLVGMILIGSMFLIVTFNDIVRLIG